MKPLTMLPQLMCTMTGIKRYWQGVSRSRKRPCCYEGNKIALSRLHKRPKSIIDALKPSLSFMPNMSTTFRSRTVVTFAPFDFVIFSLLFSSGSQDSIPSILKTFQLRFYAVLWQSPHCRAGPQKAEALPHPSERQGLVFSSRRFQIRRMCRTKFTFLISWRCRPEEGICKNMSTRKELRMGTSGGIRPCTPDMFLVRYPSLYTGPSGRIGSTENPLGIPSHRWFLWVLSWFFRPFGASTDLTLSLYTVYNILRFKPVVRNQT